MSSLSTHILTAGDLQATFWPAAGMLGACLRFRGIELLRRVDDLEAARIKGSTAGIPLLYPLANRLGSLQTVSVAITLVFMNSYYLYFAGEPRACPPLQLLGLHPTLADVGQQV